jgi:protein phosphatase
MNSRQAQLEVGARSETGYVRDENQDRMSGTRVPLGQLYIVADGMGGHKGGALAAELTVQELQRHIGEAPAHASPETIIQAAFNKTNETVYQKAHAGDPTIEGMGSTAVLLLVSGRIARVAHVGDSRAYLYHQGRLKQLTTDHTMVQKMVQAGMLKPEEAFDHPHGNILERAIGSRPSVAVDISEAFRLSKGDAILLCSDGLSGYVTDPEIEAVLRSPVSVQEVPERLINLALQKGGHDNVTVQFVQYGTRTPRQLSAPLPPLEDPLFRIAAAIVLVCIVVVALLIGLLSPKAQGPAKTAPDDAKIESQQRPTPANINPEKVEEPSMKSEGKSPQAGGQSPTEEVPKDPDIDKTGGRLNSGTNQPAKPPSRPK